MFEFLKAEEEYVTTVSWTPEPSISPRHIFVGDSPKLIASKLKYPLRFKRAVRFTLTTSIGRKVGLYVTPFNYDGATYPEPLQLLLGKGIQPSYRKASALHDYMMNNKQELMTKFEGILTHSKLRKISSSAFKRVLIEDGVSIIQASVMSFFMHLWQVTGNSRAWRPA